MWLQGDGVSLNRTADNNKKESAVRDKRQRVERDAWRNAIGRCHDDNHKQYADYGGRGIKVCDEWRCPENGFDRFLEHIGKKPEPSLSLDRIDNDKGYEPGNVRWATRYQQTHNRRPYSDEARKRISAARKGRPISDEQKAAISAKLKGRKLSPEHVAKRSEALKGRIVSEETRARISQSLLGHKHTEEAKQKMRDAKRKNGLDQ